MAKKDTNEDEYKDNLDNSSMDDDEDFGLPDLDDDTSASDEVTESTVDDTDLPIEEEIQDEIITFDDDEPQEDTSETEDEFIEEEIHEGLEESTYTPPKESSAPIVITVVIVLLLALAAVYFIFIRDTSPKVVIDETPVKDTTTYVVEKPVEVEEPIEEPVEVEVIEPTISTLKTRSGRSYVVVGSFFDDDLAMDYAKQLKKKGTSSYIIPPFGKSKFTRVAVEETNSFADASSKAGELAGQYKEQPWPLKY